MTALRIGTRGSELALWQSRHVRQALMAAHPGLEVELEIISTRGDRILDKALDKIPGKGLFTKELEESLLAGTVDLAVHSLKDLPTQQPPGLELAAICVREDPADAFIARDCVTLDRLPRGASIMTGSLRREAQLRHLRPDVKVLPLRGNVPTRIRKFRESAADGLILARAGLVRLGLDSHISQRLEPAEFLPACGQGAMAIETRSGRPDLTQLCSALDDMRTRICVGAERAFLSAMGGGCQAPLGAFACVPQGRDLPVLVAMAASLDGARLVRKTATAAAATPEAGEELGKRVAELIKAEGIPEILELIAQQPRTSREDP